MPTKTHLTAALPRFFLILVPAAIFASGCMMSQIRQAAPHLDVESASYFAFSTELDWLPNWHRLYSVLSGHEPAHCNEPNEYVLPNAERRVAIVNCSDATTQQVAGFAQHMQQTLDRVENRFGSRIHVSRASFALFPLGTSLWSSNSQFLRRSRMHFKIVARYNSGKSLDSEIVVVRSTAHELYHMAMIALPHPRHASQNQRLPEEVRASIFESCIEQDVYGTVRAETYDPGEQSDPDVVVEQRVLHESVAGNLRATQMLYEIAGNDQALSSPAELARFDRLCRSLVE